MKTHVAIGLDLGGTDLKSGLVARDGSLRAFARRPARADESADAPFLAMIEAIADLKERSEGGLSGIGLGVPGTVDAATGCLIGRTPHLPHWDGTPVAERLLARLGNAPPDTGEPVRAGRRSDSSAPIVRVDNDANLAALAEQRLGAARGAGAVLMIVVGTGVGCGIVVDGALVRGAPGGAGEIGHLPVGSGEFACACGVVGCVEPEISGSGLVRAAHARGLEAGAAREVFQAAANGHGVARELVERMAVTLGRVIAIGINVIHPDVVVVGGGVADAGALLFDPLLASVERHALASHTAGLRIVPAALGNRAGVVGAGLLVWDARLRSPGGAPRAVRRSAGGA